MWISGSNVLVVLSLILKFVNNIKAACPAPDPEPVCFTRQQLIDAITRHTQIVEDLEQITTSNIDFTGYRVNENMPGFLHFHTSHHVSPKVLKEQKAALIVTLAKQSLFKTSGLTKAQFKKCLFQVGTQVNINNLCSVKKPPCTFENTKYYRTDGYCGNPNDLFATAIGQPMIRLFENTFSDGIGITENTTKLPTARELVLQIQRTRGPHVDQRNTHNDFATCFGQIITHDMMKTSKSQLASEGGGFQCCNPTKDPTLADLIKKNPYCMPISVDSKDPFYKQFGQTCLNYIRNLKVLKNCAVQSDANPMNSHTPSFDFEIMYNDDTIRHIRENGGKFNLDKDVLDVLFTKYDDRTHQLPCLMMIVHMFANFHNVVFDELRDVLSVSDEILGVEAQKVTVAVYQNCVIQFVHGILPSDVSEAFNIKPENCFDPSLVPQVSLEFNQAFRFLHVFIKDRMMVYNRSLFNTKNGIKGQLPDDFEFNSFIENVDWFKNNTCGLIHGLLDRAWNLGALGLEVIGKFFRTTPNSPVGLDLRSFDMQLGKEVGEPSYCQILRDVHNLDKKCDEDIVEADFKFHDASALKFIKEKYKRLCDCPASFCADLEKREFDPIGMTTGMLIGEQFSRTICGDPFFFTNAKFFKTLHKRRIKRMGIRDVICLYLNCNGTKVQDDPFMSQGSENLKTNCDRAEILERFDLASWKLSVQ